ncbi:penicillin-binding transpeptidase domain-containing protein, partial [Jatrophihabitans endophyticus]|uniref:penicillin-binding transpeptidase domain-containing protein n=1 Tax=Jatrophihabitans endophyticus TaxID=1206085 RepID=UPI0019E70C8F
KGSVYANVTGYNSYIYGTSRIEAAENDILSGTSSQLFTTNLASLLTGRNPRGGSVTLTLNAAAQRAAYKALVNRKGVGRPGAIVAIDPTTGAILADVSSPTFDPSVLSSHNSTEIQHAYKCYNGPLISQNPNESDKHFDARWRTALAGYWKPHGNSPGCSDVPDDPTSYFEKYPGLPSPLFDRALQGTYPLGSVFKVIDSAAALKQNVNPDTKIFAPQYYWPLQPGKRSACPRTDTGPCIHNFTLSNGYREECDPGKNYATMDYALEKSCNTAFAALAVQKLGARAVASEAKLFGLDQPAFRTPLSTSGSSIGNLKELVNDPVALGQTAFGQRSVAVTPLQAAMISAAVADHGTLYKPYLVKNERRPNLSVLSATEPQQLSQVIDPTLDDKLVDMMDNVVSGKEAGDSATGHAAAITDLGDSVVVGGKTGTADHETANGKPLKSDSWFSGFAMVKSEPKIAVAVLLEDSGNTGGEDSAPAARKVMEAYLKSIGVGS